MAHRTTSSGGPVAPGSPASTSSTGSRPAARALSDGPRSRDDITAVEQARSREAHDAIAGDGDTERRAPAAATPRPVRRTARPGGSVPQPVVAVRVTPPPRRALATSRLGQQLSALLGHRRNAIGLSVAQVATLAGIPAADIEGYETGGRVPYDHVVVLCRVLGLGLSELPGFRTEAGSPVNQALRAAQLSLGESVRLVLRSEGGEDRFDGPVDALSGVSEFTVEIGDDALADSFPRGAVLGFLRSRPPGGGDVVVAMHKPSSVVALRRQRGSLLVGVGADQPSYHHDRSWTILGRLAIVLLPA